MPRRHRTSIAALVGLCALAAGVQAFAPASASAAANQTTCLNMPIPGVGSVPGMGVATGPDGQKYVCKLDSAGDIYGGTDKKASTPTPTPTAPICTGRGCLPLEFGGGAGSGSGSRPAPTREGLFAEMRKEKLAEMDPGEQEIRRVLCAILKVRERHVEGRKPRNYQALLDYKDAKQTYEMKVRESPWGHPLWKPDPLMEIQLRGLRRFQGEQTELHYAKSRAKCWAFEEPKDEAGP